MKNSFQLFDSRQKEIYHVLEHLLRIETTINGFRDSDTNILMLIFCYCCKKTYIWIYFCLHIKCIIFSCFLFPPFYETHYMKLDVCKCWMEQSLSTELNSNSNWSYLYSFHRYLPVQAVAAKTLFVS